MFILLININNNSMITGARAAGRGAVIAARGAGSSALRVGSRRSSGIYRSAIDPAVYRRGIKVAKGVSRVASRDFSTDGLRRFLSLDTYFEPSTKFTATLPPKEDWADGVISSGIKPWAEKLFLNQFEAAILEKNLDEVGRLLDTISSSGTLSFDLQPQAEDVDSIEEVQKDISVSESSLGTGLLGVLNNSVSSVGLGDSEFNLNVVQLFLNKGLASIIGFGNYSIDVPKTPLQVALDTENLDLINLFSNDISINQLYIRNQDGISGIEYLDGLSGAGKFTPKQRSDIVNRFLINVTARFPYMIS